MRSRRMWWVGGMMVVVLMAGMARGRMLLTMDLDSCVDMGELMVEGKITAVVEGAEKRYEVQVGEVYDAGESGVKRGDTILVDLDLYRKLVSEDRFQEGYLEDGDHLIMILRKEDNQRGNGEAAVVRWRPLFGGVRLIVKEQAVGFWQWDNPGPLVANPRDKRQMGVDAFLKSLDESMKRVAEVREKVKVAEERKDSRALVQLLRERATLKKGDTGYDLDAFGGKIAAALEHVGDLEALDATLGIEGRYGCWDFKKAFSTTDGSAFLLAKLEDSRMPAEKRMHYAWTMPGAGDLYQGRVQDAWENRHYISRVAKLFGESLENGEYVRI